MQTTLQLPEGVPGWAEKGALQAEEALALIPKLGTFLVFRGSGAGWTRLRLHDRGNC